MEHKIREAVTLIREGLKMRQRPVIGFSGGKDSMVLLHLITRYLGLNIDAVFHREPFLTHKFRFAEEVLILWNVVAFDYPPLATALWFGKGAFAYVNNYQIGSRDDGGPLLLFLPKNIVDFKEDENARWVCGRQRFVMRPIGSFQYPWDCVFCGHKDCDEDQIFGKIPLQQSIYSPPSGGPLMVFPLRSWSHDDIWDYTTLFNLPVDTKRYDQANRCEWPDKNWNSDYYHACTNCIDRRKSGMVYCPLVNQEIENIAEQVPYIPEDFQLAYFGEKNDTTQSAA